MSSAPTAALLLRGNTIKEENYIEEGYLPGWKRYLSWQAGTVNRTLTILELGEGFASPTVMRWPFEKIIFFNRKVSDHPEPLSRQSFWRCLLNQSKAGSCSIPPEVG